MPSLTLYFPEHFEDDTWAGHAYRLDVPDGSNQGRGGEWILGRHPAVDITLNIRSISRRHAAIAYSYAADKWSISDLGSTQGTRVRHHKLEPGDWHPLAIGDRIYLGSNGIHVVEDEQDTLSMDEAGPETIASTTPLATLPPAPPAPPPPARTFEDAAYLWAQWAISGSTVAGKIYRLIVLAAATAFVVVLVDLAQR